MIHFLISYINIRTWVSVYVTILVGLAVVNGYITTPSATFLYTLVLSLHYIICKKEGPHYNQNMITRCGNDRDYYKSFSAY